MYGLILENVASYIRNKYGPKVWQEILYVAGLDETTFVVDESYSEGLVQRIVWAARDITEVPTDDLMETIGESFYDFTKQYEYDKILKVLGRRFTDFLNGLDNLHEFLRFSYPKLRPPSFYCEHESKTGLTLHYRSKRRGYIHYVKGQIKAIGRQLYDTDVKIEVLDRETEDNMDHAIMRLHFNNVDYKKISALGAVEDEDLIHSLVRITSDIFFDIFPFIIVFNRAMRIRNIGVALMRTVPKLIGKKINQEFVLVRPLVKFRWENVMLYNNNVFELMSVEHLFDDGEVHYESDDIAELEEERRRLPPEHKLKYLSLKGQMMYFEQWESICFLGIPIFDNLQQMRKMGLFINDFAMHDSSRDLVLAGTQQAAEIRLLLSQEERKKEKIAEMMSQLEGEQKRADELIYQLLPRSVAEKLRTGESVLSTCEIFDSVSVLFTDVVGFTTICSKISPMGVVKFLNQMYSTFDAITERHSVFKVETIGDAYMIVSGAPNKSEYHAEMAADCAMDFITAITNFHEETTGQSVQIRAGIHSGAVVAGVVGLKMPRYCMFGDTVLIANKMESTGKALKVQISETTKKEVTIKCPTAFKLSANTTFEFKPGQKFATYWLDGKRTKPRCDK